ncbi:Putative ligase [Burkholderia cepacia]|nr:Putative ligase [Burkholderia cepacia]
MLERARAIGQALLDRGLSAERPVAILSGNDLEHLQLAFGAMWAGIPHAPLSPAYSLVSSDYGKLRHALAVLTPGLVFASDGAAFRAALDASVPPDVERVVVSAPDGMDGVTRFASLLDTTPGSVDAAHDAITGDTIAKFLFTSGSTRLPKAVPTTHRMLCSNQQMLLETFPQFGLEPPVLVDWLPWNHTFGGSHNVGIALYNGARCTSTTASRSPASSARRCATCARSRPPCISTCRRAGKNWPRRSKRMPRCAKPSSRA